ncbi:MAG: DUF1934 domain-containing protein [Bacillota bacterium]|nr:DUF1934 domain-containing protein [Bacillota bacterium]
MKKSVNLKIISTQYSEGLKPSGEAYVRELEKEDSVEIFTEGTMYERNNTWYLSYEESEEAGLEDTRTVIKLTDKKIHIKRFARTESEEGTDMLLEPGILNITRYQIPMMQSVDLEIYTNKYENGLDEKGYGKIEVDYRIKFDKMFTRRNVLEIEVMPS